jgi:hypothetical protein
MILIPSLIVIYLIGIGILVYDWVNAPMMDDSDEPDDYDK